MAWPEWLVDYDGKAENVYETIQATFAPAVAAMSPVTHQVLQWFFRNRETGAITIAQAPNAALWIVIAGSVLAWAWHPTGSSSVAVDFVVKSGIFIWGIDEVLRGVNPWRRCLGAAVLGYELKTLLW